MNIPSLEPVRHGTGMLSEKQANAFKMLKSTADSPYGSFSTMLLQQVPSCFQVQFFFLSFRCCDHTFLFSGFFSLFETSFQMPGTQQSRL